MDGKPYRLMGGTNGSPMDPANQVSVIMTPTRTSFLFEAGPVTVNATYLSPVAVFSLCLVAIAYVLTICLPARRSRATIFAFLLLLSIYYFKLTACHQGLQ